MNFIKKYGIWLAMLIVLMLLAWHFDLVEQIKKLAAQNGKAPLEDKTPEGGPPSTTATGNTTTIPPTPDGKPIGAFPKSLIGKTYLEVATRYNMMYNVRRVGDANLLGPGLIMLKTLRLKTAGSGLLEIVQDAWIEN